MLEILTECQLFKDMTERDKQSCVSQFHYQVKKYQKGDIVVYAQDVVIQQLILLSGSVKNEMTDFNGNTIKIADLAAPRILAPGFLFGNHSHYPVNIIANSACEIFAISKSSFLDTMLSNKQLQLNFLNVISNQTQFLTRKINFLKIKTIRAKIAYFLLKQQSRQKKNTVVMPQSQTQLADLFGVTRPSLSRAMSELSHQSIIKINGKQVTLLDVQVLKSYLTS